VSGESRILIAGGGTGGHIYPALAIAAALQQVEPDIKIEFVGTPSGLEAKLVPRAGYELNFISVGRLNKNVGLAERLSTLVGLPIAILRAFWILITFRPTAVIGVGGFASGPLVFAASLMRIRSFIWEPNAYPGLANRILSRFVDTCLVVFKEAESLLKNKNIIKVHMPIRKEIEALKPKVSTSDEFHLLVFGGSQGSRALNNILLECVAKGGDWLKDLKIVHQTGSLDYHRLLHEYANVPNTRDFLEVHEYLHDMPSRLDWADLVIARAGTGTISELAAAGKPGILVPLPTAADDHQTRNAEALVKTNAAVLIAQKELTPERLIREIESFKSHREKLLELSRNIQKFHQSHAALEIAKLILAD
jgi:UDP-N-acetylglucosamine--N-acetylmuramyl-(pentapeptide) pyrophosphoryl-undecaprenol N-acetylglucosamine transferase